VQAVVSYPNLEGVRGGSIVWTVGIEPSVIQIDVVPRDTVPDQSGDLTLSYGSTVVTLPNCKIDSGSIQRRGQRIIGLRFLDRRWMWRDTGEITGRYNLRDEGQNLITKLEKTPQELAALLFEAMGESSFDVGRLPNDARPQKEWVGANPARELDELCESLGCVVVLGLDNVPRIKLIGQLDSLLPTSKLITPDEGLDSAEIPDSILVIGGITKYQGIWNTEAVGKDTDGSIVPIDQLSYTPSTGWENESPKGFYNVLQEFGRDAQSLAREWVFRKYRITSALDSILSRSGDVPETWLRRSERDEALPIHDTKLSLVSHITGGLQTVEKPEGAVVRGQFWDGSPDFENTASKELYEGSFSIDRETGIISFNDPVYRVTGVNAIENYQAALTLETTYSLRNTDSEVWRRERFELQVRAEPIGTGPFVVRRDDLVRTHRLDYTFGDAQLIDSVVDADNIDTVRSEMQFVAESTAAQFVDKPTSTLSYSGIVPIDLDGAVRQVSWRWGNSQPAITDASLNFDKSPVTPTLKQFRQRRRQLQVEQFVDSLKQLGIDAGKLKQFGGAFFGGQ